MSKEITSIFAWIATNPTTKEESIMGMTMSDGGQWQCVSSKRELLSAIESNIKSASKRAGLQPELVEFVRKK